MPYWDLLFEQWSHLNKPFHVQEVLISLESPYSTTNQKKPHLQTSHPNPICHYNNLLASHKELSINELRLEPRKESPTCPARR